IGYPIWYSMAPRVVVSMLEDIKFAEKTKIIPFCTSDNTGIADSIPEIKDLQPQCSWLEGKRFGPSFDKEEVDSWIGSLGIIEN
ncbi:MAG: hypothetical protein IJM15_05660, partial [Erysipelotrichaceae bacterium]|nr:hypothetical protein [Erysipelotrichaceae bacterium]